MLNKVRNFIYLIVFTLCMFLVSCTNENSYPDRINTKQKNLYDFDKIRLIEKKYPSLQPQVSPKLFKIIKVICNDQVILSGGQSLRLVGVLSPIDNKKEINEFISKKYNIPISLVERFATIENSILSCIKNSDKTVTFIKHRMIEDGTIEGYLYSIEDSFMKDPELKSIVKGPMISCINEMLILSGLAVVDEKSEHKFNKKYMLLQKEARRQEINLWSRRKGY